MVFCLLGTFVWLVFFNCSQYFSSQYQSKSGCFLPDDANLPVRTIMVALFAAVIVEVCLTETLGSSSVICLQKVII